MTASLRRTAPWRRIPTFAFLGAFPLFGALALLAAPTAAQAPDTGWDGDAGRDQPAASHSGASQSAASSTAALQSAPALPDSIPVFPLPDIALLPGARMPLHIFEPRYREMVADALEGDGVIGMVMLRPGWEEEYQGNPPVYAVGGAGRIESADELSDGRYNIVLRGTTRFRIRGESTGGAYRRARVEPIPETLTDEERVRLADERDRIEEALRTSVPGPRIPTTPSDVEFVNTVVQYVPVEPADRQALVEAEDALARARLLLEVLGVTRQAG